MLKNCDPLMCEIVLVTRNRDEIKTTTTTYLVRYTEKL